MSSARATSKANARFLAWGGLVLIAAVRVGLEFAPLSPATAFIVADTVTYFLPMALVITAGCVITMRTLGTGVEHRFWGTLVVATACVLVAEAYWTWYAAFVDPHGPPIDAPVRVLHLLAAVLFMSIGVTITRRADESLAGRLKLYIDTLSLIAVVYPAMFWFWTWPSFAAMTPRLEAASIGALYPVFGLFMLVVTLGAMVGWKVDRWRLWERLTASSLAIHGTGLLLFPLWFPALTKVSAVKMSWPTMVLGTGFYLLFVAIIQRLTTEGDESLERRWPIVKLSRTRMSRYVPVGVACVMFVLGERAVSLGDDPRSLPVLISAICLAVLLGARSWVSEVERGLNRRSAVTDHATGAYSRRHLDGCLEQAVADSGEDELSVIVFDIDGFGRFEDQDEAAAVLGEVAAVLESVCSPRNKLFRLGADQFAAILPATGEGRATAIAGRAVTDVRDRLLERLGTLVGLTAGVAVLGHHANDGARLLDAARDACRAAKGTVGAQVAVSGGAMPEPRSPEDASTQGDSRARAARDTVIVLAAAVDARDPVTRNHSAGVAELMTALCRALGLAEERVHLGALAGLVHDVGKIGVPDSVLYKLERLSAEERELIEDHAELGERILAAAHLHEILPITRHHHERWDGRGYPDGLEGHQIPFEARALAVCDTFETLIAGRPYQAPRTFDEAIEEIEANAGSQFDPMVATVFVRMVRRELGAGDDGLRSRLLSGGSRATA